MGLVLREAEPDDRDLLFRWANDPTVRENAFSTASIPYEDHVKWFAKVLEDQSIYQYILCEDEVPVGQIRLNVENAEAVISYSVSVENRNKGYGIELLQRVQGVAEKIGISRLIGQVKYENKASSKAFEKCGYSRKELPEYILYELVVQTESKGQAVPDGDGNAVYTG